MKHYEDFFNEAQQYSKILKNYEENGEIFSDNNFHPDFSITETKTKIENFTWRRIDEFYPAPLFKREFIRPDDIDEGSLSDSGLVSALAWAASRPERVIQLFSVQSHKGQPDSADLNCGAVVVLLHSFGRATPILIDTRVPFLKGTRRPAFSRPRRFGCSAWFCLVEKAVAKLLGGYSAVSGIRFSQACYILFGFLPDSDSLLMKPDFTCMVKWLERGEVIGATAESDTEKEGKVTEMGLVEGCVYLISKARSVSGRNFFVVRSPRASIEWLGEWSSTSVELTRDFRSNLGLCGGLSGTFCMIDSDFFSHFKKIDVSQQKECLKHSVRIFTRIKTGDYDGCEVNSQTANLESHQTFAFKLKSETQISDEVRVDVVVEKWSPPNISDESDSGIDVVVAFSGGKKLTHESLTQYSHQEFTSKEKIFSFSFKVTENSPCVIVFNRNTKRSYSEECYATLSCDYEFDIYDVDNEEEEDIFTNEINSITQMTVADDITQKDSLNNEALFASGFSDHDFFNYSSEDDIFCMIERELASFSHINEQPTNSSNDDFNERIEKLTELSKNTHLRVEDKIPPFFSSVRSIVSDACNIQNENEKQSNFIKKVCSILKIDQNEKKYEDILNILQKRLENNESDFANENAVKKEEKSQNVADEYDNPLFLSAEEACQTQSSNEKDQVLFNSEVSQKSFQKESNSLTDNDFQEEEADNSNDNQIQFNPEFEISIEEEDEIEIRFQPIKENEEKLNQDESDEKVQYLIDLEAEEEEDIQFKQNDELSVDSQIKNEILSNEDENSSNSKQEIIPLITNETISDKQENKSEEAKTTLNKNENPTQTQIEEKQNEVKSNDTDKKEETSPNEKETKKQATTKAKRKLNSIKDENEFIKQPIKIKKKNSPETDTNLPSTQPKRTTNSLTRKRSNSQIVSLSAKNKEAIQIDGLSDSQKVNAPQLQTSLYPSVVDDINDSEGKGGKIWKVKPSDDPEKPFVISRENSNQKQKRSRRSASQKNQEEKCDNNQKKIEKVSLSEPLKKIKHKHTVDVKITINDPDNEAEISVKKNFNQNRPKRSRSKAVSKNQKKETVTEKDKSKDECIDTVEENEPKSSTDVKKRKENRSATKNDSEKVHHTNKNIEKKNENSNKTKNDNSKDKKNENSNKTKNDNSKDKKNENSNEKKKENSNKTKNENSKETKKEKPSKKSSEKEKVNRRASSVKCHEKRSHDKEKAAQSNCQKSVEISVAFDRSKNRVSSECSSTVSTSDTSSFFFPFSATYQNLLRKRQRDYDDDFEFNFDEFDFDIKDRYWDTKLGYEREYFNLKTGGRYINPSHVVNSCRRRNPSVNYNRRPIQENYVNFLGLQSNQINCSYLPKRIRRY